MNRLNRPFKTFVAVVAIAGGAWFLLAAGIKPLSAAPAATTTLAIGVVDLDKVAAGSKQKAALDEQLKAMNDRLQAAFSQQTAASMLTKDDQDTLYTLLNKENKTDPDTAQITQLEAKSNKDAQDLTTLQQKTSPTDDDKTRLATLTGEQGASQQILNDIADRYRAQAQVETDKLQQQLMDSVDAAIAAVAQAHGLTLVFSKQVALYGANDITNEVLDRLNK